MEFQQAANVWAVMRLQYAKAGLKIADALILVKAEEINMEGKVNAEEATSPL